MKTTYFKILACTLLLGFHNVSFSQSKRVYKKFDANPASVGVSNFKDATIHNTIKTVRRKFPKAKLTLKDKVLIILERGKMNLQNKSKMRRIKNNAIETVEPIETVSLFTC